MMKVTEKIALRAKSAREARPAVICCLGDSVTHGCFELIDLPDGGFDTTYRPYESYGAKLSRMLNALYPAAAPCVMDAGISGDSAPGGLARLARDVLSVSPDLVFVDFGLNDAGHEDVEAGLAAYRQAMARIFDEVLAAGSECMLLTPNAMCRYVPAFIRREDLIGIARHCADVQNGGILDRYVEAARDEARARGLPVADAYAAWERMHRAGVDTTMLLSNGINHPTPDMHDLFAALILDQMLGADESRGQVP